MINENLKDAKGMPAALSGDERLQSHAARAQETDRLAQAAEAEVVRLRKEMKRARKAYKAAKQQAKQAAKEAEDARAELSACLDEAFRDLAMALQEAAAKPNSPAPEAIPSQPTSTGAKDEPAPIEAAAPRRATGSN